MKYILDFKPDSLHVTMTGTFTFVDAWRFRKMLSVILMVEEERTEVRLNVEQLDFLDSTAIALMMRAHDLTKRLHLTLVFEGARGQVNSALQEASQYNALNMAV